MPIDRAALERARAAYTARLRCVVAGETVCVQASGYYGGWITAEIVEPFKGEPGTGHW
ncbi:hypothetical protein HW932_03330 [Allochromatium humboldtianum]|uniref:Uncharacterized protein n=1 Tax=Allochromatium humboldtianum TaxID=504901 RepID=A0A850R4J4_9GAMM|nr:hypothetical protein [Allochromatium humboldtianum]NVZ08288.1 hypothetical protein [Allochromatium humboldtianum]